MDYLNSASKLAIFPSKQPLSEADLNDIFQTFNFVRNAVTEKLFEIYLHSKNQAFQHKHENYMIFKVQIQDIMKDRLGFIAILMHVYSRLLVRSQDFLPKMDRIRKKVDFGNKNLQVVPDDVEYK